MFYGPTPVDDALRWYEEQQAQHPIALTQQAMLEAMRGNFDRARALAASADAAAEEFGQKLWLAAGGMALWEIETLAGDPSAAERAVRRSCELLEELGEVGYRFMAVSQLAASLYALERLDEADEWTRTAEELDTERRRRLADALAAGAGSESSPVAASTREAEQLAREAVSLAEETDMLNFHGNALADLAEVYALAGRTEDAREQLEQALVALRAEGQSRRGGESPPKDRGAATAPATVS